jgi:lipopolysaccharide export system ATP-binding protein
MSDQFPPATDGGGAPDGEGSAVASLPQPIRDLLEHQAAGDSSAALAFSALLRVADDAGAATLDAVAECYRSQYLASLRMAGKDAEGEAGRLGMDSVRDYLSAVILPRLVDAGMAERDVDMSDPGSRVWVAPRLWAELGSRRSSLVEVLRRTGEHAVVHPADVGAKPTGDGAASVAPAGVSGVVARGGAPATVTTATATATAHAPAPGATVGGSILEATGLVKMYKRRRVVNDVALRLQQGEIVGLLGPNGAGKTTVFYMIVGLIQPMAGRIVLDGADITGMAMYRRARRGIGYLSQEPSIFRKLTVEENILAILETLPLSGAERRRRLETLLDELSIKHLRDSKAYALSGGERRRLEITRALVTEPKFMMLDEPFAGVDPIAVHDIQTIVAGLRHRGIGVLISDHNVEQTLDIVDRAYIMFDGQVKVSGTVRELIFDDTVADIYLGPTLTARLRARFSANDNGGTAS